MLPDAAPPPAARALADAMERNLRLGHENLGALSVRHGFLAARPPEHDLPAPYDAWVAAVDELPDLCRELSVRRRLEELPMLPASADVLDERHLLRAASVLGLLAHAYGNVPMRRPERLPEQLVRPWLEVAQRLGRPPRTLSNTDFIFNNWRLVDPHDDEPMRVENLRLLDPVWDHPEMETFILVLVEMLARAAPLVGAAARAQEACLRFDDDALEAELGLMADTVRQLTRVSLPKISPNARAGRRRVDPVIWTKLFAMLPLPLEGAGVHTKNASGAETPYFHVMDVVLGRRRYTTQLGREATLFRRTHPPHWRAFIEALEQAPIADAVQGRGDRRLAALLRELEEAYHGRRGLLGRHRLKAFAYMDAAFKTGRTSTVTGFSGLFEDRAWETVDRSFEAARLERRHGTPAPRIARVERVDELCRGVQRVVLDVRDLPLRCDPGDRCAVAPQNDEALVARTLAALRATGDEPVDLTGEWSVALPETPRGRLRDILRRGHIRPVTRAGAKALYTVTHDQHLRAILEARTEDQWELWDLLELLAAGGFAPQRLWRAQRGESETLSRIVPPLQPRLYSVSAVSPGRIELTVGQLTYDTIESPTSREHTRRGTASHSVCRPGAELAVDVVSPVAFGLPDDPAVPVVMLAAGTGIAPFVAFLQARTRTPGGENLLIAGARDADSLPHRAELERHAARDEAEVHFAYSRDRSAPRRVDELLREPAMARRLRELVDADARIYVCGRAAFARSVLRAAGDVFGRERLFDLIARNRYMQDVFTTYTGSTAVPRPFVDASDLAQRCTPSAGMWVAISGRVYDLTDFAEIHPGGAKLIQSFAGTDATASFRIVEHHRDPEVDAQLSMFEIGVMRRLEFGSRWAVALGERGLEHLPLETLFRRWLRSLYVLVEVQNAHRLETSIREEPLHRDHVPASPARTPYRLQFAVEAHRRLVTQTVPFVCLRFSRLWQTTSGPCSAELSARALGEELERLLAGPEAHAARQRCDALERALEGDGATAALDAHLVALEAADAGFLQAATALVASGIRAFERYEGDVLAEGTDLLLDSLGALPRLARDHLAAVAAERLDG